MGIRPVKTEWWGAGMVISLERGADLHTVQLTPLPLTVSCFSKIQIGFTFLVLAHSGSPGKGPLNGCVCVCHRNNAYSDPKCGRQKHKYPKWHAAQIWTGEGVSNPQCLDDYFQYQ